LFYAICRLDSRITFQPGLDFYTAFSKEQKVIGMKKEGRGTKFIVIGLIAILIMALGALAVFAQDDATPEAPELPTLPDNNEDSADDLPGRFHKDHFRDGFNGSYHGRFGFDGARSATDEALAEALGITVEELQAAREKVAADRIAQAVEDGILTRDEANTMLAMQALKGYLDRDALLAGALGLSIEELGTAREDGTLSVSLDPNSAGPKEVFAATVTSMVSAALPRMTAAIATAKRLPHSALTATQLLLTPEHKPGHWLNVSTALLHNNRPRRS
jgi:hypothetical protein